MMRCFIGINLPLEIKKQIHQAILPLQKDSKGWEKAHDYHQTLLFIGEVTADEMEEIKKRLVQFTFKPFELKTDTLKFFNRRILYLDLVSSSELQALAEQIKLLFPEWSRLEEKAFLPHVTIKRWQRYEYADLKSAVSNLKLKQYVFKVQRVSLFLSERDSKNQKYHVIYETESS